MDLPLTIYVANAAATLFMTGLIWFVQIVHYPLFALVGRDEFGKFQSRHQFLTTIVVGPPMLIEAFSSMLLVWYLPQNVSYGLIFAGIALIFVIWISTAVLQVPCHQKLESGYDIKTIQRLVSTNWFRTVAWSCRAGLVCWMGYLILN